MIATNFANASYDVPAGRALDCIQGAKVLEVDEQKASARGVLAASSEDRCGDIINIAGIRLEAHARNPVSLFQHGLSRADGADLPIGQFCDENGQYTVELFPDKGVCVGTVFFHQKTRISEEVCSLVMSRDLRAFSIGYRELDIERRFVDDRFTGSNLNEIEALEFSVVVIGMNADCVRGLLSKKIGGKALSAPLRAALLPFTGRAPIWSPGVSFTGVKLMGTKLGASDVGGEPPDAVGADEDVGTDEKHALKACRVFHKMWTRSKRMMVKQLSLAEDEDARSMIAKQFDVADTCHDDVKKLFELKKDQDSEDLADEDDIDDKDDEEEDSGGGGVSMDESEKAFWSQARKLKLQLAHRLRVKQARTMAGRG